MEIFATMFLGPLFWFVASFFFSRASRQVVPDKVRRRFFLWFPLFSMLAFHDGHFYCDHQQILGHLEGD